MTVGCRPTSDALEALPGVGPYTARAVAAIAFGLPIGAVDMNVRRVLGRIVAGDAAAIAGRRAAGRRRRGRAARPGRGLDPRADGCRGHALPPASYRVRRLPGAAVVRVRCRQRDRPPADPAGAATRIAPAAFASTSRWLRGRIVDRLRAARTVPGRVVDGSDRDARPRAAVLAALTALATEGLIELAGPGSARRSTATHACPWRDGSAGGRGHAAMRSRVGYAWATMPASTPTPAPAPDAAGAAAGRRPVHLRAWTFAGCGTAGRPGRTSRRSRPRR